MSGRDHHQDSATFYRNKRRNNNDGGGVGRGGGGGRHHGPPSPPPVVEGFGGGGMFGGAARFMRKSEKYNPTPPALLELTGKSSSNKNQPKEKKHKTKYVSLYGEGGKERAVIKLPGRHECNCQASVHGLVGNCLKCGRIVCEQEGSGRCFFCTSLVCSREEQKILDQGGRKAEELRNKLLLLPAPKARSTAASTRNDDEEEHDDNKEDVEHIGAEAAKVKSKSKTKSPSSANSSSAGKDDYEQEGLEKAVAEKNRLLEYQRSGAQRTMVYDDQSDYFNTGSNSWLTPAQREKLRKREDEILAEQNLPRSQRKVTLDIAGRRVIEEHTSANLYDVNDPVIQEIYFANGAGGSSQQVDADLSLSLAPDDIHRPGLFRPIYGDDTEHKIIPPPSGLAKDTAAGRLQDNTLQDLLDQGRCLSMHQPYASLLVRGIKKHEGRSWYTGHRGVLWIASTAKNIPKEDIAEVEQFYRSFYNNCLPSEFPTNYQSGCLLGCVDVVDCLPQEQYQELYPAGESESPYVWICANPRELSTFFPIRGQHKIYQIDPNIHKAAKKMITKQAV